MKLSEITIGIIFDELRNLDKDDIICLWNTYCEEIRDPDSGINSIDDIDDYLCGKTPTEILDSVVADFNTSDYYFSVDGYGYFYSFNSIESNKSPIDFEVLADWIIKNQLKDFLADYTDIELEEEEEEEDGNYHLYAW